MSDIKPGDIVGYKSSGMVYRSGDKNAYVVAAVDDGELWLKQQQQTGHFTIPAVSMKKVVPKWEKGHVYAVAPDALWDAQFRVVHVTPTGNVAIVWNSEQEHVRTRLADDREEYHDVTELAAQQLRDVP